MDVKESLKKTSKKLKFDYDSTNPEWFLVMHLFNLLYYFPDAEIRHSSSGTGYHVYVDIPSSMDIRRFHREDKGRLWCTSLRAEMLGADPNHDIIYREKGTFKVVKNNGELIVKWEKPPRGDGEPLTKRDLTMLPWNLRHPIPHRKRRMRWWKKHGRWK